jgi:hypothetical protein
MGHHGIEPLGIWDGCESGGVPDQLNDAIVAKSFYQLDHEQRTAGGSVCQGEERGIGVGADHVAHYLAHCAGVERRYASPYGAWEDPEMTEQVIQRATRTAPSAGEQPKERVGGQLGDEALDCPQGDRIGPLQIVEGEEQWPLSGPSLELRTEFVEDRDP